jgi:hypothetical protein
MKTNGGTREGQLDPQRRKENKITLKSTLVVFFLPKFVVHRSLKNALERQQGKGAPANTIATQDFDDRKNHLLLTTRSSKC